MNYEEKYKQALERARESYRKSIEQGWTCDKEIYEQIFPELRESEDEKIRKAIINLVKATYNDELCLGYGYSKANMLTWLFKPSEQTENKVKPKFKVGDVIRLKGSAAEYTVKRVTNTAYYTDGWSCGIERCEEDYELVEQKPTWSKEDEQNLKGIIATMEEDAQLPKDTIKRLCKWLKFIKDRVQPKLKQTQQKLDWSEEDEYQINTILHGLDLKREHYKKEGNQVEEKRYKTQYDWLKSLKPNHWKPSEYDISLLEEIARNIRNNVRPFCSEVSALEDLIKNIKTL